VIRAGALALLGRRALAAGSIEEALRLAEAALALVDGADLEEGEAEVWLMVRDALTAAGEGARAEAVSGRARRRLEQLAARITDPEARRSFLDDVPEHRQLLG
jgi:eukaryotic-like serine/threonine-protein kinase